MNRLHKSKSGFTIVELMIATAAFSILLMAVLSAFVYLGRLYYKGVSEANTQEVARTVLERASQAVQFSGAPVRQIPSGFGWDGALCVGNRKYSYRLGTQLVNDTPGSGQSNQVLVESEDDACQSSTLMDPRPGASSVELLDELMRLNQFSITPSGGLVDIDISIVFGGDASIAGDDDELFIKNGSIIESCRTGARGTEFCAVANIGTTVYRKVN